MASIFPYLFLEVLLNYTGADFAYLLLPTFFYGNWFLIGVTLDFWGVTINKNTVITAGMADNNGNYGDDYWLGAVGVDDDY